MADASGSWPRQRLRLISIDEIKKGLPGYDPAKADEFHSQSAKIANALFDEELAYLHDKAVVLMCGGSASGKTEFLEKFFPENFDGLVFDSTFSTQEGARVKIQHVHESGNRAIVCMVLPDDLRRAFRAFGRRDRVIPERRFFETHSGARKTALWVADRYPGVEIVVYVNSYRPEASDEDGLPYEELRFKNRRELVEYLRSIQLAEAEIRKAVLT